MTRGYILKKDHLVPLLRRLGKENRLVAPVCNSFGDTLFTEVEKLDEVRIDLENQAQGSLKPFFLPQQEVLATYQFERTPDQGNLAYSFQARLPRSQATVYFGVRSCDMFAVMYTDMMFLQAGERDNYYEKRRDQSLFITITCNHPFENCFCNATGTGPFLESGFDLQLTDIGDSWFVETGRAKGVELVKTWSQFFLPASEQAEKLQYQAVLESRGLFSRQVHVEPAIKALQTGEEPTEIFAQLSERCQDCGGCAFICPTCCCFTIVDQPIARDSGERVRAWDACTFSGFTVMAGGHNPIDGRGQRIRKRFLHKLLHDVSRHGRTSCVGCGRCVGICFGGVDIVRFIDMVNEAEDQRGIRNDDTEG